MNSGIDEGMVADQATWARWVEVDLDALAHNVEQVKSLLGPGVLLLAVVKGNGYGHGLVHSGRSALARGADMLGVTHPADGVSLREAGITAPVMVFRPLLPGEEEIVVRYGLTSSLSDLPQAQRLDAAARAAGQTVPVHLKIETGMGRTGFTPASLYDAADQLFTCTGLRWEGIYTHFAAAGNVSYTRRQYQIFCNVVEKLAGRGITFLIRHVCNSAATILYPEMHLDMVRTGTLLYGQLPSGVKSTSLNLKDTWSFWTKVSYMQKVRRGTTVGYGRTYRARQDTVLAVLPVGYSDGFGLDVTPRPADWWDVIKLLLKTTGTFLGFPWGTVSACINGAPVPVVGRIGMELSCVDVGKLSGVEIGTPVQLKTRRTVLQGAIPRVYKEERAKARTAD